MIIFNRAPTGNQTKSNATNTLGRVHEEITTKRRQPQRKSGRLMRRKKHSQTSLQSHDQALQESIIEEHTEGKFLDQDPKVPKGRV